MRSSSGGRCAAFLIATVWASRAGAQQQPQGFAVERLYPSAPGGGWVVMDALDMRGGLGAAVSVSSGYAHDPLRVSDGVNHVAVVSGQSSFDVGLAVTYDRFRLYLNLDSPLLVTGTSGTVGNYQLTAPDVNLGSRPDTLSDARVGFDARLLGGPKDAFRLGAGAQLIVPSGNRSDYVTDGDFRAMLRMLAAGDVGRFTYAGQLGVHVRPLDDAPAAGSPQGSELLFGVAAGPRFPVDAAGRTVVVVGPEIYGETAFNSFLGTSSTGVEGLLTGRVEGTGDDGAQLQAKLGIGAGLDPHFGAPQWRFVFAVTLLDHDTDSDGDGISDSKDACPHTPGLRTSDPKTNGCPADRDRDGVPDAEDACPDAAGSTTTDPKTTGCPATPDVSGRGGPP